MMAISMYNDSVGDMYGYTLVKETSRYAIWEKDDTAIVAVRGTDVTAGDFLKDLLDDFKIAFDDPCSTSLVSEVATAIPQGKNVIFTGHSLGGATALCLAAQYPNSRGVSFNGGAPMTNPFRSGPGPARGIHYHIEGDLVSSHMDPGSAKVVRIRKGEAKWGSVWPHGTERFLEQDGEEITANQEQSSFNRWSGLLLKPLTCQKPIPGSTIGCFR